MSPNYVVRVIGKNKDGTPFHGTGFLVDSEGHVVTCWHVVKDTDLITVQLPYSKPWKYRILEARELEDIALLESVVPPGAPTPFASLNRNPLKNTAIGSQVMAWGCSALEHYNAPQRFDCTISGFSEEHGRIGLNGDINPGDSGAPVVDVNGSVVGIAQLKDLKRGGQAMAIPVSSLIDLLKTRGIIPFAESAAPSQAIHPIPELSEHFLGREEDLKRTLEQVRRHRVVTLTGIGGIGKTEMAKAVARAAEGQDWAADGVFYVDLQTTTDTTLVKGTLVSSLALNPDKPIPSQLAGHRLYVLDDLYQALVEDRKGIQGLVRTLHDGAAPTHFLLTCREPVGVVGVENPCPLGRLLPPHDADLFRRVAETYGYKWRDGDSERLTSLLQELDGYPLAVMIAANWLSDSHLEIILRRWEKRHTAALTIPGISDRDLTRMTSVDFSLALSFNRLPEGEVRTLFALFADLPAGAKMDALEATMGDDVHAALMHLVRCSLVQKREDRYVMLVPVREFAARSRTEGYSESNQKLDAHLIAFAEQWCGNSAVWNSQRRREANSALYSELPNFSAAVDRAKTRKDNRFLAKLISNLCRFIALTHEESEELLLDGIAAARAVHDVQLEANCLRSLGDVFRMADEQCEAARQRYEEALGLYQSIGDRLGEASCIDGLGDLQIQLENPTAAWQRYEEAVLLYRSEAEKLGEANCLRKIAELEEDDHQKLKRFEAALALFRSVGDELGEANCLRSMGGILANLDDSHKAQKLLELALLIFRRLEDKPREGNCLILSGQVDMKVEEYESAREKFEGARKVYADMDDQLGQGFCLSSWEDLRERIAEYLNACMGKAQCMRCLGDVLVMLEEYEEAKPCYMEALTLYQDPRNIEGEASCRGILGALHSDLENYSGALLHYEEARKLYAIIGDQLNVAEFLHRSGEIHEHLEQHEQSWSCFQQALGLYASNSNRLGQAKSLRGLADVHLGRNQYSEARQKYDEALKLYEGTDPSDDLAATYRGIARACREGSGKDDAIGWMEKLVGLYELTGESDQAQEARNQAEEWRQEDIS